MLRSVTVFSLLIVWLAALTPALAAETLTLGVFAYRPKAILEARYQPLADYLTAQVKDTRVVLRVLDQQEMEEAMARQKLDLVLTNPSHFALLRSRNSLSGALATLISLESGQATAFLGGVIITRADTPGIADLPDLRGRSIAVPGIRFLGGYQTQAYELLQAGLRLPEAARLDVVNSHDAVVEAVLKGRAEAGFIRTGVLEEMTAERKIDPAQLRVVSRQHFPGFPYAVSTRLYPEWPFVALPHVDSRLVRRIASALLALEADHPAARASGIAGFAPPGDYMPVENLARALRLPPYDRVEDITWHDLWQQHRDTILVALGSLCMVGVLLVVIAMRNRQLNGLNDALSQSMNELWEERDLITAGPSVVFKWAIAPGWPVTYVSPNVHEVFGHAAEELMAGSRPFTALLHPDDAERLGGEVEQHLAAGKTRFRQRYRVRHGDGSWHWVDDFTTVVRNGSGKVVSLNGYLLDITESLEAETALHESQARFRLAVFGADLGVWDWHIPSGTMTFNDRLAEMLGYSLSELPSSTAAWQLIHPEDRKAMRNELDRHLRGETAHYECEHRLRHKDGRWVWVLDRGTVLERAGDESPVRAVGTYLEITARKQAEFSLAEKEERYRSVVTTMAEGVVIQDRGGMIVECNPAAEHILGLPRVSLLGSSANWHAVRADGTPYPAEDHPAMRCQRDGAPVRNDVMGVRRPSGETVWISVNAALLRDPRNPHGILAVVTSFSDITTRLKTEHDLQRSNTELEHFAYTVSHDLRQPLRMVSSCATLLQRQLTDLDEESLEFMQFIQNGVRRMDQMLMSLLEYSRVGRHGEPKALTESGKAVEEALLFLGPAIREADAVLQVGTSWPRVYASGDELTRLFQNLIGNALKYRSPGRRPEVTVEVEHHAEGWKFCVADNGIGIAPEHFDQLFKVFNRLHTQDEYEGTGIGLAVCRKIVERHGGRIWVESEGEGQGARFCFILPAAPGGH